MLILFCKGLSNEICWYNQYSNKKSNDIVMNIHWNSTKYFSTELDNQGLNNNDRNHYNWEFLVFADMFKHIESITTCIKRVENDGIDSYNDLA